jgi:hypothetical protein
LNTSDLDEHTPVVFAKLGEELRQNRKCIQNGEIYKVTAVKTTQEYQISNRLSLENLKESSNN